jgi:hypothetical protein
MNVYYTYAYLRDNGTPYYIGKGKGRRIHQKNGRPCGKPKDKSKIIFLKKNLTESEAFKHEIYMIFLYGRKDLGEGILHNKTNGGDGASGAVRSEETKKKMSEANMGENNFMYGKTGKSCPNYGKPRSEETKKKLRESKLGIPLTEEVKKKMSQSHKGKNNHMYGKTGEKSPNYGKPRSQETKDKISKSNLGKTHTQESKEKISKSKRGKVWITNGEHSYLIDKTDSIPQGFVMGRIIKPISKPSTDPTNPH